MSSRSTDEGGSDEPGGIIEILRELDVPEEVIERAIERGDPEGAILEAALLPRRAERTISFAEVEAQGGLSVEEIGVIFRAMGFSPPEPDEPALDPEEARVYVELAGLRDIWSPELTEQNARIYGRLLARIARTGVQLFRLYAEPRLLERSESRSDQLRALRDAFERLLTIPAPLLVGVHRRWIEYELTQQEISVAQAQAPDLELAGTVEVTLLFCDLKDFTAYANAEGDAAAVKLIGAFARTVDAERGGEGTVIKALGDGHMLSYADPAAAVAAGSRIIEGMRAHDLLGVHASVHSGIAISREGDYFGGAVNLAARLLGAAGRDELVATAPVVEACGDSFAWESIGVRGIRGVDEAVEVFRLR